MAEDNIERTDIDRDGSERRRSDRWSQGGRRDDRAGTDRGGEARRGDGLGRERGSMRSPDERRGETRGRDDRAARYGEGRGGRREEAGRRGDGSFDRSRSRDDYRGDGDRRRSGGASFDGDRGSRAFGGEAGGRERGSRGFGGRSDDRERGSREGRGFGARDGGRGDARGSYGDSRRDRTSYGDRGSSYGERGGRGERRPSYGEGQGERGRPSYRDRTGSAARGRDERGSFTRGPSERGYSDRPGSRDARRGDGARRGGFGGRDESSRRFGERDGGRGFSDRSRGNDRRGEGRFDERSRGGQQRGFDDRGGFSGRGDRGAGWSDEQASIRGPRSWDAKAHGDERPRRKPEPVLPEEITGYELDKAVRQQLRTLSKENAEGVARHLVAAAELLEEDPQKALDHAQHAVSRAGRVPAAREALGLVLYRTGEYAEALREFRTARRLSGSDHLLPYMVDCERGLGRFERALELANSPEAQRLSEADNIELAIVVSGVRRDMGQARAAVVGLRIPALHKATTQPWAARLFYAYADALMDLDERDEAREWFVKADAADRDGETDAADRIDELDGFELTDLTPEDEQEVDPRLAELDLSAFGGPAPSAADTERSDSNDSSARDAIVDAAQSQGPSSSDASAQQDAGAAEGVERRAIPSASFDDGSPRD